MLTVDFGRFPLRRGDRVLDLGCGAGRHAFEVYRRGAHVVALDYDESALRDVAGMLGAMRLAGEVPGGAAAAAVRGDATALPFPDDAFDGVIAAEILEHLPDDEGAMAELVRVLRPGGLAAVTVPRRWPERACWALSEEYHQVEGGHVRIYSRSELVEKLSRAGLRPAGEHHAHALHAPYWWLKCAVGVQREDHPLARAYHRVLVWDITYRPWLTRVTERALNPVMGKSLVVYLRKPEGGPEGQGGGEDTEHAHAAA
ncbi:MAG: methyltransferase domain-containing protein [Streptosporangiales bacterium]|nr:methyltransferase domain-containing protein [Streptosporangiales bacterium]